MANVCVGGQLKNAAAPINVCKNKLYKKNATIRHKWFSTNLNLTNHDDCLQSF